MNVSRDTLTVAVSVFVLTPIVTVFLHHAGAGYTHTYSQTPLVPPVFGEPVYWGTVVVGVLLFTVVPVYVPEGWLDTFTDHEH